MARPGAGRKMQIGATTLTESYLERRRGAIASFILLSSNRKWCAAGTILAPSALFYSLAVWHAQGVSAARAGGGRGELVEGPIPRGASLQRTSSPATRRLVNHNQCHIRLRLQEACMMYDA